MAQEIVSVDRELLEKTVRLCKELDKANASIRTANEIIAEQAATIDRLLRERRSLLQCGLPPELLIPVPGRKLKS
ncbi:hypothetical protein [uncultured Alistipes sp.]|uniref:hypothetical protein n=1 Tax=uncultured Alistipes sp. TaxID=538949 RepID=UPI002635172B|nr:hypothetical protein [uncultured Alistipes sp.]